MFYNHLKQKLVSSLNNNYSDNFEFYLFEEKSSKSINLKFIKKNIQIKLCLINNSFIDLLFLKKRKANKWDFNFLYTLLKNEQDKEILISLIAYKILGHKKVKLPDSFNYFRTLNDLSKKLNKFKRKKANFNLSKTILSNEDILFDYYLIDLVEFGFSFSLYGTERTVYWFLKDQYQYQDIGFKIEKGDYIIDGGACTGDDSLLFAYLAGKDGMVFSFEMMEENLEMLNKNVSLNKNLSSNIQIIKKPLSEKSNIKFYAYKNGPGSYISTKKKDQNCEIVESISIDDFVNNNNIKKIDLIKMDIEGAELSALRGAKNTIEKFKPKLAICVYHKTDDFDTIPKFINSLNVNYEFYLKHHGITEWETVLYCKKI